jgi:hypothetical protein
MKKINLITILSILFTLCIVFSMYKSSGTNNTYVNFEINKKRDSIMEYVKWRDSIFTDYKLRANIYLSQDNFKDSPITGDILSNSAKNTYDSTGIIIPLELVLAQAHWESNLGRAGRTPKTNPFNIGEYDNITVMRFNSTHEGVQAYYDLIANRYLRCKTIDELLNNFTDCDGFRYATSKTYENSIQSKYNYIRSWIDNQLIKNTESR